MAEAIEEVERREAKKRQAQAGPSNGKGKKPSGCGKLPQPVTDPGKTRDKVGAAVGLYVKSRRGRWGLGLAVAVLALAAGLAVLAKSTGALA